MSPDSLCRWQGQVSVYCVRRMSGHLMCTHCSILLHPVFNHVAPYRYLLPTMCLFMADIANPDLFVCGCQTWIFVDITRFYEEQRQPSSGFAWPACPKNGKFGPHCWGREVSTQFAQQFRTTVTAHPFVGCVVWS